MDSIDMINTTDVQFQDTLETPATPEVPEVPETPVAATPSSKYVKLDPAEAKRRRIAAAHKRWATIKARRAFKALVNS